MGTTITSKKGQLYISYTANKQRKLFAVRPTITLKDGEHLDKQSNSIYTGNRIVDRDLNQTLSKNLNWFLDTVERLEKYEKRQATVGLILGLHQEEFLTEKKPTPKTFDAAFEAFLDYKRDVEGMKGKSLLEYSNNTMKRLKVFLKRYKYKSLEELDKLFLNRLYKHLLDLNYSKATYSLTTGVFKNFCKFLLDRGLISAETLYLSREILKSKAYSNIKDIALTLDEVKELYEFQGVLKAQVYYKDLFVFNCIAGGMRYSDLRKIKVGDLDLNKNLLHVYTQKNKSYITIPLIPLAVEIIRRCNPEIDTVDKESYLFELGTSLNSLNVRFKLIAKSFYRVQEDGKRYYPYRETKQHIIETANKGHKITYKPYFKFFKSSLCRRTFITILLEQNYNFEQIKLYTGHRSYKAFSAYPKLSQKSKVETLHKAFSSISNK